MKQQSVKHRMGSVLLTAGISLVLTLLWNKIAPPRGDKRFTRLGSALGGFIAQALYLAFQK